MMAKVKDSIWEFGGDIPHYARRYGRKTARYAHDIGWKRGGIALGVLATVIAVPFVVRYVRNRRLRKDVLVEERGFEGMHERRVEPGGGYVGAY